ncbi:MAG TPA: translation elongation factor Ts [Candidatus Wallbacteria bacterium]|nr:translation elongation factor Ts [Candidatus Wallbacteria bacterium]
MEISASMVKELREKSGCGMMDCKKALLENEGDLQKSMDYLRKKGLAMAKAKADRTANEGIVYAQVSTDCKKGVLVEVNCETDFVAKTDEFQGLAKDLAAHVFETSPSDVPSFLEQPFFKNKSMKVNDFIVEKVAAIKENISVKRLTTFNAGLVHSYIHMGSKLGVLLEMTADQTLANNPEYVELSKDLTMQIAAANPLFIDRNSVPKEVVEKEKEIYRAQMAEQKKPANVIEKIIEGKINKYFEEICLLEQSFVKNPDQKVNQYLAEKAKKLNQPVTVKKFVRFKIGE